MRISTDRRRAQVSIAGWAAALALAGLALLFQVRAAQADATVGDGTPGSCDSNAIQAALNSGSGIITFNCGPNPVTIVANTYLIGAGKTYSINGNNKITLTGENDRQIFSVDNGGDLTLRDLTITNAGGFNGAAAYIETNGSLTLRNVTIRNSGIDADRGGAIYNEGLLEIERSTFQENQADERGGVIYNAAGATASIRQSYFVSNDAADPVTAEGDGAVLYNLGTMTLETSTLNQNDAKRSGGGIYAGGGTLEIVNSTIMENTAGKDGSGGGLFVAVGATVSLLNVTVERNNADTGGGIWQGGGVITLKNTIVANSSTSADTGIPALNCDNGGFAITTQGHNLISDSTCVTGSNATDIRNTNPKLNFIDDNGGPTPTLLPLADSPVIDAGDDAGCPATDQRGVVRPAGDACDIGAIEVSVADAPNAIFLPMIRK